MTTSETKIKQNTPLEEKEFIVCPNCSWTNDAGKTFCKKCGSNLTLNTNPNAANQPKTNNYLVSPKVYAINKNPTIALVLSLFLPGVGQFYNGDNTKGIVLLLIWVILGAPTLGLVWIACWIYGLIDAYDVASAKKAIGTW